MQSKYTEALTPVIKGLERPPSLTFDRVEYKGEGSYRGYFTSKLAVNLEQLWASWIMSPWEDSGSILKDFTIAFILVSQTQIYLPTNTEVLGEMQVTLRFHLLKIGDQGGQTLVEEERGTNANSSHASA